MIRIADGPDGSRSVSMPLLSDSVPKVVDAVFKDRVGTRSEIVNVVVASTVKSHSGLCSEYLPP